MKKEKTKYEGAKNILQIVEKLLNSGTLAVSSCTNLALIKTAASLENTFIFQKWMIHTFVGMVNITQIVILKDNT